MKRPLVPLAIAMLVLYAALAIGAANCLVLHAEQPKAYLKKKRAEGLIRPLGPIAELTDEGIDETHRVVGMMGVEPFQKALEDGAQVVIAGRATDASIYSAIPLMRGYDPGLVWHLAKIIECAGQVTTPRPGQDCVLGTLGKDYFLVEPGHPDTGDAVEDVLGGRDVAHAGGHAPAGVGEGEDAGAADAATGAGHQCGPRGAHAPKATRRRASPRSPAPPRAGGAAR